MEKINKPSISVKAVPPKPPVKIETRLVAPEPVITPEVDDQDDDLTDKNQPIPPATNPMQYRAIGVIYGRYLPTEEHFSKGTLTTPDGTAIDTVVLGKVIPILKKRLDLAKDYLWVVYPRTIDKTAQLHVQIAGVWAPVEMGKSDLDPGIEDGYFSIRGEVVEQSLTDNCTIVKIKRTDHRNDKEQASTKDQKGDKTEVARTKFKLTLSGILPNNPVGYFWDIKVQRRGSTLAISYAKVIAPIPKKPPRKPVRKTDTQPQFKSNDSLPKIMPKSALPQPAIGKPSRPIIKRPKI